MSTPPTSNNNSLDNSNSSQQQEQHTTTVHPDVSTFLDPSLLSQLALPQHFYSEDTSQSLQYPQALLGAALSSETMGDDGAEAQNETAGSPVHAHKEQAPIYGISAINRVSRACASCRSKKVRCEGGQPKCQNCLLRRIDCFYPEQKKRGRPSKAQASQQTGDGSKQRPTTARRDSPRRVSSAENSGSDIQRLWRQQQPPQQPENDGSVHVSSDGHGMALFPAGELASDGSFRQTSFQHSFSFDAINIGQSPVATSKPLSSSMASSHAFHLGYSAFNLGQQAAGVVSPMDASSPGIVVGSGLGGGQPNSGGGLERLLYSTSHNASAYTTPTTGNIQQGYYNYSPSQPQQQQQQQRQTHQDDYFGRVQIPSSSMNTPLFHTSSAENTTGIQRATLSLPSNTRPLASSGTIVGVPHTSLPHMSYSNSAVCGLGDHNGITARADSGSSSQLFSTAWSEAVTMAPLTQPQNAIYNGQQFDFSNIVGSVLPFTSPAPAPYVQQQQQQTQEPVIHLPLAVGFTSPQGHEFAEKDLLSSTLGNVAMAISKKEDDSDNLQKTMDHLLYLTENISNASQQAFEHAKEVAAEALATADSAMQTDSWSYDDISVMTAPISEALLRMERRPDLSSKSVHNYFSYIHHQCPIIHKPTFLRQMGDGSVNRFVWFSLRALTARTLLHSQTLSKDDVLVEEAYFAAMARKQLAVELDKPTVEVLQGLVLLALYILGTPRWEEASMYWCKATRLAQLMGCNIVDAPSRAVATKMHFGIFEPPATRSATHDNLGVIPGGLSGLHLPLAQTLTPFETELRRRLWWILFTNERFGAVAERLPTMVDESRIFVHLPCSTDEWEKPVFTYTAPEKVPKYRRDEAALSETTTDSPHRQLTLIQEIAARKEDNLYMISDIEYGFAMGHLVTFLANMGSLFRPLSPYSNDYVQPFAGVGWQRKVSILQANVERIEGLFENARRDTLQRLNAQPQHGENGTSFLGMSIQENPAESRFKKRRDSSSDEGSSDSKPKQNAHQHGGFAASSNSIFRPAPKRIVKSVDLVLDTKANVPGIEIPHLHHLNMLILYSTLNIQLYRMVFQIHYDFSSSLPVYEERKQDDKDLLAAFDKYVTSLWLRATTAAQQVSRILRGDVPNVPHWVLTLAGIKTADAAVPSTVGQSSTQSSAGSNPQHAQETSSSLGAMDVDSEEPSRNPQEQQSSSAAAPAAPNPMSHRLKRIFRERIKCQEKRLHEMATSVFTSYRRTMPYALLLAAKVHVDNIKWWANEKQDEEMARAYLDLAVIVQFLETHQTSFSSTDYVSLVKSMMQVVDISS
ncbi:hypothetical protein EV175_001939 [Coemansia sp. RSA 1933]|nr:hypothetical protein EV175_001939 [Coemansia sp. RSA 1933]